MNQNIFKLIELARYKKLSADGIIHGVRRIKQGKHGSRSSAFYSAKNHAFIPVESRLERDFCYQLEADPSVAFYRTQAIAVPYRESILYPDFLIFDTQGNSYIREIKHSAHIESKTNSEKISYLMSFFQNIGLEYGVVTEIDMWSPVEKSNWAMLYDRGGRLGIADGLLNWLVDLVNTTYQSLCNMAALRQLISKSGLPFYLLEAALFNGSLRCRMDRLINPQTLIEVAA